MKIKEYQDILKTIENYRGLSRNCSKMLIAKYDSISKYSLYSILSQQMQNKMKFSHQRIFGNNISYYDSYLKSIKNMEPVGVLLRLAEKLDTSPALLARNVLEEYINKYNDQDGKHARNIISKMLKDTTLIEDKDLSYEIYLCILYDDQYGVLTNAIQRAIGEEYEVKLENYLKKLNIPYYDEVYLRSKGYDKTPDTKLELPIAVNGFVINWIESKAQFGSDEVHKKYEKNQYTSYWNRFGPGLVIYWFGFLESIVDTKENKFIIMDNFPENITRMDPQSIAEKFLFTRDK